MRKLFIDSLAVGDVVRYENMEESYEVTITEVGTNYFHATRNILCANGETKSIKILCHKSELYPI